MLAGLRRRAVPRPRRARTHAPDAGFTLTEVLVSMMLVGVVMGALTTFYAGSMSVTSYQRGKQTAVQLASSGMERVRAIKASDLASPQPVTSPCSPSIPASGVDPGLQQWDRDCPSVAIAYNRYWFVGDCWQPAGGGPCTQTTDAVKLIRVVVAVTWRDKSCQNSACTYATSTLVNADSDPIFDPAAKAPPPTVYAPASQSGYVGDAVQSVRVTATGSAPPLTFWATGLPDGLQMDSSGLITGIPAKDGVYTVTATASDGFDNTGSTSFQWAVAALPALADPGTVSSPKGASFNLDLKTLLTGGVGPFTWSVTKPGAWGWTGLPPGLSLNTSTGVISGTPPNTTGPPKDVTVTVKDKNGKTATRTFGWSVVPRITIGGTFPPTSRVGKDVSLQPTVDGTGPYTWTSLNLPDGLTMGANGLITGKVARGSRWVSTITVTDSTGATGSLRFAWTTTFPKKSPGLALAGPGDQTDAVGQDVSILVTASGGTSPYPWTATGLPDGVTPSGNLLSGTLTKAGVYPVTITVIDKADSTATYMFVWTVR